MTNDIRQAILDAAEEDDEKIEEEETTSTDDLEAAAEETASDDDSETETTLTEETTDKKEVDASAAEDESTTEVTDKPPLGWSPASREHWAGLDEGVRKQISKREAEVETFMRETAEGRKQAEAFTNTVAPFRELMAAEGASDPIVAVKGLLDTAAVLARGSKDQKAARMAQMIGHYGIDIETLDNILSGSTDTANPQTDAVEAAIAARLKPMEEMFQGLQQRQTDVQNQNAQQINDDIAGFQAKSEFFEDVRYDMADIMDMAAKRGQTLTLQDAYDKACALHPEVSKVMAARARQADLGIKKEVADQVVNGRLDGDIDNSANLSLRGSLEAAWEGD